VIALWLRVRGWIYGLAAFAGLLLSAWLLGRSKGRAAEQVKTRAAQDAAATDAATNEQLESRHETDVEVQRLPDAPAQVVADADPATAAGRLQSWTRD